MDNCGGGGMCGVWRRQGGKHLLYGQSAWNLMYKLMMLMLLEQFSNIMLTYITCRVFV